MRSVELARHFGQQLGEVARIDDRGQEALVFAARGVPIDAVEVGIEELLLGQRPELLERGGPHLGLVMRHVEVELDQPVRALGEVDLGDAVEYVPSPASQQNRASSGPCS